MSNVLDDNKQQQVLRSGDLGWSLRRIEEATGVRRETASGYLKAAGIAGARPRPAERIEPPKPAISAEVSTDLGGKTGHYERGGVHRPRAAAAAGPRARARAPASRIAS